MDDMVLIVEIESVLDREETKVAPLPIADGRGVGEAICMVLEMYGCGEAYFLRSESGNATAARMACAGAAADTFGAEVAARTASKPGPSKSVSSSEVSSYSDTFMVGLATLLVDGRDGMLRIVLSSSSSESGISMTSPQFERNDSDDDVIGWGVRGAEAEADVVPRGRPRHGLLG